MSPPPTSESTATSRWGGVWGEFDLALLPTITVLPVLTEAFSRQMLLVASSAFLIYLDLRHRTSRLWTLLLAHCSVPALGFAFRSDPETNQALFGIALTALLAILERASVWLLGSLGA